MPIISVITSLSGGEYSSIAGVTRDSDHMKFQFSFPLRGPSLIILDPIIALTTPLKIWLGSGMRALDHCIEGFNNPGVSDEGEVQRSCVEGLKALVPGLLATAKDSNNADARLKCLLGVNQSMVPLHHDADFGASHGIGHMLGPLGVAHGETSCVLNPAVCAFNAKYGDDRVRSRQAALAKILWNIEEAKAVFEAKGYGAQTPLSALVDAVIRACEILPRSLREVDVGRERFEALAKNSIEDVWCTKNAVPVVRTEQVMEILAACA